MARKRSRSHGETTVSSRTAAPRTWSAPTAARHTVSSPAPASRPARLYQAPASFSSTPSTRPKAKTTIAKAIKLYRGIWGGPPPTALVCLGRSARKQVLHALGKAGKRGQKRPRYTAKSKVRCP